MTLQRASRLFSPTLKEVPADATLPSHQLMLRAGLIRRLASGLYTWLPMGLRVLQRVEQIVREEMNGIGCQEILMPMVQPRELWDATQRWDAFGRELLTFTDRHDRDACLGPTHEEVITDLLKGELKSYKQCPLSVYQIQTKFRDEIRPRFGVMRAREFMMKDAYSFHMSSSDLESTYDQMYQAYCRIFSRLGLTYRSVLADTGSIGGHESHEFHVLADSGEDVLAISDGSDYAANVERASAYHEPEATQTTTLEKVSTPGLFTVEEQCEHLSIPTQRMLKTILVQGSDEPVVALIVRGDDSINPIKAEKHPAVHAPLTLIDHDTVMQVTHCQPGFVGPIGLSCPIVVDHAAVALSAVTCGANEDDWHWQGAQWGRDIPRHEVWDLRHVQPGDRSPDGDGHLTFTRGIEVGHIFQLGTKYAEALGLQVLNESGQPQVVHMGCYGIGLSRLIAAAIEQSHDEHGIIWPASLAPFDVHILGLNMDKDKAVMEACESMALALHEQGHHVLLDDRPLRAGAMFADADLWGVPWRITVGCKQLAKGLVEISRRDQPEEKSLMSIAETLDKLRKKPC